MSKVKLPYHPEVDAEVHVTRFGVLEITMPMVYEEPIPNKVIVRADILEGLREELGDNVLVARSTTYSIVSGTCDDETLQARFASYYRKYAKVTEYVNKIYEIGNNTEPLVSQVLTSMRGLVDSYQDHVKDVMEQHGGKYLVTTHCYMYYAFSPNNPLPELEGLKTIC